MSTPDRNFESYAHETDVRVVGPRLIDGQAFDDALKFSNCSGVLVEGVEILGGREDCIDINRGGLIALRNVSLHPKGKYGMTIKGGAEVVTLRSVVFYSHGSEADIDLGNWSDQSGERTRGVTLENIFSSDGKPVIVRVLHADLPLVLGGNVRVIDRRWLAWFYRLGKRWGVIGCLAFVLLLAGCASGGTNVKAWNPFTWFSGSEARSQAKAIAAVDTKREAVLKAAQIASHETAAALASAPASRPVEVATESASTATALMDQALGAPAVGELAALRARVSALLSENEQVRAAAERERAASRADAAELSQALDAARAKLIAAQASLADAFARENALANQLRNQRLVKWVLVGVSLIAAAGWVYVRYIAGGLPSVIGRMLARADVESPQKAAAVRELLDPILNRNEQAKIAKHVARTALKIKTA